MNKKIDKNKSCLITSYILMPSVKKSETKKVNSKNTKNVSLPLVNKEPDNQEPDNQEPDNQEPDNQEPNNQEPNNQEPDNQEPDNNDSDNNDSDSNDSDSSSDESDSNTSDDEDNVKIVNVSKDKKLKKTWQEIVIEWEKVSLEIKEIEAKHKELQEALHKNEKNRNELERQRNRLYSVLSKSHDDEIKRVVKLKPKRKGNKKGGFNKETPVPPKLIKYLGLEEGTEMSRPKVMSLLNNKFKTVGLKNGQITTLDKNTAKSLEKEENREIKFTEFQSFIKEFYDEVSLQTKCMGV